MPCDYTQYPDDWEAIARRVKFERANGRCERCGLRHGALGWRDERGVFHECEELEDYFLAVQHEHRVFRVVLTCAHHPDPDPMNNQPENLHAWCRRCHIIMDTDLHVRHRKYGRHYDHERQITLFNDEH